MKYLISIILVFFPNVFSFEIAKEQRCRRNLKKHPNNHVSIDISDNWFFLNETKKMTFQYPAIVPGNIYLDLIYNKLIDDPFPEANSFLIKWVENINWKYFGEFYLTEEIASRDVIEFVVEEIDTHSEIFLNGKKLLDTHNYFVKYRVNIKEHLIFTSGNKSKNKIEINFHPKVQYDTEYEKNLSIIIPADSYTRTPYTRSPPFLHGWDWAFRAIGVGIGKSIKIEAWNKIKVLYFNVQTIQIEFPSKESNFTNVKFIPNGTKKVKFRTVNETTALLSIEVIFEFPNSPGQKSKVPEYKRKFSEPFPQDFIKQDQERRSHEKEKVLFNKTFNDSSNNSSEGNKSTEKNKSTTYFSDYSDFIEISYKGPFDYEYKPLFKTNFTIKANEKPKFSIHVELKDPSLWWPYGTGNVHGLLYDFQAKIKGIGEFHKKTGIRTVVVEDARDEYGQEMIFSVNSERVFMRGSNYVPADMFHPYIVDFTYLFESMKHSKINMVRVWGGGQYEDDQFYDLCDKYGILVFQDFIFSTSAVPGDDGFLENVENEAYQVIMRLKSHPSLALWNGNNEGKEAWDMWGISYVTGNYEPLVWSWYREMFEGLLPYMVQVYDSTRYYQSTSPFISWASPSALKNGDSHYWGIFIGMEPLEAVKYMVPRFMTEYGMQAVPSFHSLLHILKPRELYFDQWEFAIHEKHSFGLAAIKYYMYRYYNIPSDIVDLIYVGQVLQIYATKMVAESHRRNKGYCWGSLVWQLSDPWPTISWSSIDYYGYWKGLQYQLRDIYQTISVSFETRNDSVYVINDELRDIKGNLTVYIIQLSGLLNYNYTQEIEIKKNEVFVQKVHQDIDHRKIMAFNFYYAKFVTEDKREFEGIEYFVSPKTLLLHRDIELQIDYNQTAREISLYSSFFVYHLYIYLESEYLPLSDNYFHLMPNRTKTISILDPNIEVHKEYIRYKTYNEIKYKND